MLVTALPVPFIDAPPESVVVPVTLRVPPIVVFPDIVPVPLKSAFTP